MKTILAFICIAGAHGLDCQPGYKHRASLTGRYCKTSFDSHLVQTGTLPAGSSAVSYKDRVIMHWCSDCCEKDPLKCGGQTSINCGTDKYEGKSGLTGAAEDAWKNKATTATSLTTDCCEAKATCGSTAYTCPAGMKKVAANAATKCSGGVSSCAGSTGCCELDVTKCGGLSMTASDCTGTTYLPSGTQQTVAWKNTAATATNKATNCCLTKAKCGTPTCPAGQKAKASVSTTDCLSDAASCASSTCCEADTTKCGGVTAFTCATTHYKYGAEAAGSTAKATAWMNTAATEANKATACCTTKATCAAYTCPAGCKDKTNKANTNCTSDAASCDPPTCCDPNILTCGGNTKTATVCAATTHTERCPLDASNSYKCDLTTDSTYQSLCNAAMASCQRHAITATALATAAGNECCEAKATCTAFRDRAATVAEGSASGAYQLRPDLTMAMAVIAFLFMGQK